MDAQTTIYVCPIAPRKPNGTLHTVTGCGGTFVGLPDEEGIIDCPHCGMWFDAGSNLDSEPSKLGG